MSAKFNVSYHNNNGVTINLNSGSYRISSEDLVNYEWSYDSLITQSGTKITRLYRGLVQRVINLHVRGRDENDFKAKLNALTDCFDFDIANNKTGKLYVNGAYLSCYISASTKTNYWVTQGSCDISLTVLSPYPSWIVEENAIRSTGQGGQSPVSLGYPHGYPYGYTLYYFRRVVKNDGIVPADFKMTIYGPCTNPSVTIAGHLYKMNITLANGEHVEIDSKEKTIYQVSGTTRANVFNKRYKASSIFEKIPVSSEGSVMSTSDDFNVSIFVYAERSEPWIIS